jgi:hypothetical protein
MGAFGDNAPTLRTAKLQAKATRFRSNEAHGHLQHGFPAIIDNRFSYKAALSAVKQNGVRF